MTPKSAATHCRILCVQVRFINAAAPHIGTEAAYAHGAHLVLLDGIGLGVGMPLQVRFLPLTFPASLLAHVKHKGDTYAVSRAQQCKGYSGLCMLCVKIVCLHCQC